MTDKFFKELFEVTEKTLSAQISEDSTSQLTQFFALFSKESHKLQEAYQQIEKQLEQTKKELEKANLNTAQKGQQLKSALAYLNLLLKKSSDGFMFINLDGAIAAHNIAADELTGKKDLSYKNYFHEFPDNYFGFSMKQALSLGSDVQESFCTLLEKPIKTKAFFVLDAPEPYQGLVVILQDLTEINKLKENASRQNRLQEIGKIAATVAHEIKNPLGGIRGFASLLARDLEKQKHLKEMAEQIIDGTKTLERLVSSILHFTRPICLKVDKTNLSKLIKDLIKLIKADPSFSEDIFLECHVPYEPIFTYLDKELFSMALLNIVRNALEAIEKGGYISISLIKNNGFPIIDIADNGIGMTEQEKENLFSPFFTTKQKGNGLGLSEAHKIIVAHMGKIDVRSAKGTGTTFTITLPPQSQG